MDTVKLPFIDEDGWIHCRSCKKKTRTRIRPDTVLRNFPLYCPKCGELSMIDAEQLNIRLSLEPDARRRADN